MSPRGKAKAKQESDENGREKRVRESRNVKATSYKDLSDSDDEKPARRRKKKETESESLSEDEKPKKRVSKGRRVPARSRKEESDSEEVSDFVSEESSGEDSKKKRKSGRKPARSLRASQRKASYKDLSNSESDSNEEEEEEEDYDSSSEKEDKSKEKRKRGRPVKDLKKAKKEELSESGSEGAEEEEEEEGEEEEDEEDGGDEKGAEVKKSDKKSAATESSSDSKAKGKDEMGDKPESEKKADKKPRPEHELSEEGEEEEEEEEEEDDGEKSEDEESKTEKKGAKQEESGSKKRGRPPKNKEEKEEKGEEEPEAKKAKVADKPAMNKTDSDYGSIDFTSEAKTKEGNLWNLKISSWNVAGLKAWLKKSGLEFIKHENPDILCLQETKCSEKKLPPEAKVEGYHAYWLSGEKEGYAGVALLSKTKPIEVKYGLGKPELDNDGRVITAEFDKFFVVNVYVPNAGQGLKTLPRRMEWDPIFRAHLKSLDEKKPVILCGDLNVAHNEIDLTNPKTNIKNAGFTPQEREGMTQLLKEGFVDTFRNLYPDRTGAYSFWTYMGNARSRNVGWRLDYFITSERFLSNVCDNVMRSEVYGSDHCPITLFVHI